MSFLTAQALKIPMMASIKASNWLAWQEGTRHAKPPPNLATYPDVQPCGNSECQLLQLYLAPYRSI